MVMPPSDTPSNYISVPSVEQSFAQKLSLHLPLGCDFQIHYLTTPLTQCPALFSPPPSKKPEKTWCESHFLTVSIKGTSTQAKPIQVFGIEVLHYVTKHLTTLFVSKADSTGYLYLLGLQRGLPSPFKLIIRQFLQHLVNRRKRSGVRLVISLFARSQNQYLFPGSVENSHKHVLDDRRLIKWWCDVLDDVFSLLWAPSDAASPTLPLGFLKVPGCDQYETATFYPKSEQNPREKSPLRWSGTYPLHLLSQDHSTPERCLIPRFPDDPKARFLIDLDDELPDPENTTTSSPVKVGEEGRWRSVRSLDQFWDMMSFRQECSAGRLVGFIWGVITEPEGDKTSFSEDEEPSSRVSPSAKLNQALPTPLQSQSGELRPVPTESPLNASPAEEVIMPPSPRTPTGQQEGVHKSPNTEKTPSKNRLKQSVHDEKPLWLELASSDWTEPDPGPLMLSEKDYQRMMNLLLKQDYANTDVATKSTGAWINAVAVAANVSEWGWPVHGRSKIHILAAKTAQPAVNTLNVGLIKKKKKKHLIDETEEKSAAQLPSSGTSDPAVSELEPNSKKARIR